MKGSIRHLPARDCWQARWYDKHTGKERTRTFAHGVASERVAGDLAVDVFAELRTNATREAERVGTVAWYAERWLKRKTRDLSPTTIRFSYGPIVAKIIKRFGSKQLDAVRPVDVREWYDDLRATGLTQRTVERHHGVLRAMYRDAVEDELVVKVPTTFKRPPSKRHQLRLPDDDRIAAAIAAADGDFGNLIRFASLTGMRRGELLGLRWSDLEAGPTITHTDGTVESSMTVHVRRAAIELQGGGLETKEPKSGHSRTVIVLTDGIDVMNAQLASITEQLDRLGREVPADGAVFADIRADVSGMRPRRPGWATQRWSRHRRRHGLDGLRIHDLRHAHATRLIHKGVSFTEVAKRLGHLQTSTTVDMYTHSTSAGEIEAARAAVIGS